MKRFLLLPLAAAAVAWVATAGEPPAAPAEPDRLDLFRSNLDLVTELVKSGLRLAEDTDTLRRAQCCNDLAAHLAKEINHAATERQGDRAWELSGYLNQLLTDGVASPMRNLRRESNPGSNLEQEFRKVSEQVKDVIEPIEKQLGKAGGSAEEPMQRALKAVLDGRAEVDKALAPEKPPKKK